MHGLERLDVALFLALNGSHARWADAFQLAISAKWIWIPLYGWLLVAFQRIHGRRVVWLLAALALLVAACDQSSNLVKWIAQRPRPCHEPTLAGLVHMVRWSCGGAYGFVSGHAANSMGPALFLHRLLPRGHPALRVGMAIYVLSIGYSRIYLGRHYPGDVLGGWLLGAALGLAASALVQRQLLARALPVSSRG
jgi:undecaprenyl-diphosphatase